MFFRDLVSDEFGNFNNFVERKYVLSDVSFTRKGKLSLESTIKYLLCNNRKTMPIDINRFLRNEFNDRVLESLNKQFLKKDNLLILKFMWT